jgi:hypothetical protein
MPQTKLELTKDKLNISKDKNIRKEYVLFIKKGY